MENNQNTTPEEIISETTESQATPEQPETPADAFSEGDAVFEQAMSENQEDEATALRKELGELKDKYLRLYAEFDNYRKRTAREKLEMGKTASRELMVALLPVVDDFERAVKSDASVSEGVRLVHQKMQGILEQKGLKVMESTGERFDADLHEAVTEFPAPNDDMKGKVIDTVEKGFYLHDVIIRYAKVVVGR